MTTMLIQTFDKDLVNEIWKLQSDDVKIEEYFRKAEGFPTDVTVYINLGVGLINLIAAILNLIKTKQGNGPKKTETIILKREQNVELENLVIKYKDSINIDIRDED